MKCLFCDDSDIETIRTQSGMSNSYLCKRCGHVNLTAAAVEDFEGEGLSQEQKTCLRIHNRTEFEGNNRRLFDKAYDLHGLKKIIENYTPMSPLDKLDNALLILEKNCRFFGEVIQPFSEYDDPYYNCVSQEEMRNLFKELIALGFLRPENPQGFLTDGTAITTKGYARLREIKRINQSSKQCFVAMWFAEDMISVYEEAIKPAIEYRESGQSEPRYRAVRMDNVEHVNDINDEIIAQIRRSRFVVCDLTGYRGGVYFEAGFAYGLGLDVIYTCRKDWTTAEKLVDENKKTVAFLYDGSGNKIGVGKEGVHFDLSHRNRIEWEPGHLDDFRKKLENRIKAVIV